MNKLITIAFLLMALANVSYGQGLTYLYCERNPALIAAGLGVSVDVGQIWVLSISEQKFDSILLWDDDRIELVDDEFIEEAYARINGILNLKILYVSSERLTLDLNGTNTILNRISGEGVYAPGTTNYTDGTVQHNCSPITKSQAEALIQERIDRRDEIIKENEANRLF
jgi:hypothetical protein